MNLTALALSLYVLWFLILLSVIVAMRVYLTLSGKRSANSFSTTGEDVSPFSQRLCRAHANCYEAMPYIGGLLLLTLATNTTEITNSLAIPLVVARLLQSSIHLLSTRNLAAIIRVLFLIIQIGICFYWVVKFIFNLTLV